MLVAPAVHLRQLVVKRTLLYQLLVLRVQQQGRTGVLDGVVGGALDVDADEVRGEEAQGQLAVAPEAEELDGVDLLCKGRKNEIVL